MKNDGIVAAGSESGDELAAKAEEKLTFLKENYAHFDATAYETEIAEFKRIYNEKYAAANEQNGLESEFNTNYDLLFATDLYYEGIQIGQPADAVKAQTFIDDYKARIATFLASEAAELGKNIDKSPAVDRLRDLAYKRQLGFNMNFYTPTGNNAVLTDYYHLQLELAWAQGLRELFGEEEAIEDQLNNIQAGLDFLKSPENAVKIAEKNAYEQKAKAKLFPEAMHNAALLADIRADLQKSAYWKGITIENLRVTNPNWQVTRHPLSGAILYRKVQVQCTTSENGICTLHEFYATEEYNGTSYSKCFLGYHNQREMLCENAAVK